MKIIFTILFFLLAFTLSTKAQTAAMPHTATFGKVSLAELELKQCDFEKDANAMVLFDKGDAYFDNDFYIVMERYKRVKIFDERGKDRANLRIEYISYSNLQSFTDIQMQTVNLVNGKPEITKFDKSLVYTQKIDKYRSALIFAFPNVKAGSVIELKYRYKTSSVSSLPNWYFQDNIPTLYSEYDTEIPDYFDFKTQTKNRQQYLIDEKVVKNKSFVHYYGSYGSKVTDQVRAMEKIPSLSIEPYMGSISDNLQSIQFQLVSLQYFGNSKSGVESWKTVGEGLCDDIDFGRQLDRKLKTESTILDKAKLLKTPDEKIAYIFNAVKTRMKSNDIDTWYTIDGTSEAWERQSGCSSEINLALCRLLKQAGLKVYPMLVSTRDHGKINPVFPFVYHFNRAVAYIPVDSAKEYILDASGKYNVYNETPDELLNSNGFYIDNGQKIYKLSFIERKSTVRQIVAIQGEIKPDGIMEGSAQISSFSYNKVNCLKQFNKDGDEKYKTFLKDNDNTITIFDLKMENADIDSLPLIQKINFKQTSPGSDGTYIYFNPNVFNSLKANPFLSDNRATDIDFGYPKSYAIKGDYKIPAGYKIDALPKTVNMVMPDQSITMRRMVEEQNGKVMIYFIINYKKTIYFKEDYAQFKEFHKKMHELLDEPIVLKKV
jgi:hypothetical protein